MQSHCFVVMEAHASYIHITVQEFPEDRLHSLSSVDIMPQFNSDTPPRVCTTETCPVRGFEFGIEKESYILHYPVPSLKGLAKEVCNAGSMRITFGDGGKAKVERRQPLQEGDKALADDPFGRRKKRVAP